MLEEAFLSFCTTSNDVVMLSDETRLMILDAIICGGMEHQALKAAVAVLYFQADQYFRRQPELDEVVGVLESFKRVCRAVSHTFEMASELELWAHLSCGFIESAVLASLVSATRSMVACSDRLPLCAMPLRLLPALRQVLLRYLAVAHCMPHPHFTLT